MSDSPVQREAKDEERCSQSSEVTFLSLFDKVTSANSAGHVSDCLISGNQKSQDHQSEGPSPEKKVSDLADQKNQPSLPNLSIGLERIDTTDVKAKDTSSKIVESNDVEQQIKRARARLAETATGKHLNMAQFTRFMDAFELRCRAGAKERMIVPDAKQIAKTYDNLADLLDGTGKGNYLKDKSRAKICEQALHNLAFPKEIDQGQNPTCGITSGEIYMASRCPDSYTDLIKQVSTTGKYKFTRQETDESGRTKSHPDVVKPPGQGILPGSEEEEYDVSRASETADRSWASKIYQVTSVNIIDEGYTGEKDPGYGGTIDGVKEAIKNISGTEMPWVGISDVEGGLAQASEKEILKLKEKGNLPAGVGTIGEGLGFHGQVIHDVRVRNGRTEVWLDNQWGRHRDPGWISMNELHRKQGYSY